ncbi:hypothetical protein PAXRUDRAFT_17143 [Paxillus rubicundulus Ve08.2h10]|uniref:Uncharacterized protein n=1 Tax=Paxillus rubicundulus Ve08.2h10 TaxID=930991 RepID=A0A0D0DIQ9_9AGAM|nr:hypothetical protein PAXRUDRAFT_17143 [Paxillus rubicundulus Ve08.2h10]
MPQDTRKVRFTSEAMVYHLPTLVIPAQPKPRKNKDCEATGHHARPGELVIPAAPKTAGNQVIRPPPQRMSTQIDIPSRPKKAHRISTTHQSLSTLFLPSEPKASHSHLDSVQSTPVPSNPILAPDVFNEAEDIVMDCMDVDPSPSQINPSVAPEPDFQPGSSKKHSPDVLVHFTNALTVLSYILTMAGQMPAILVKSGLACKETYAWIRSLRIVSHFSDTLAAQIGYQATPDLCKIDYEDGLNDLLKRAMEDYQQMFAVACKRRGCVLEWQKRLVAELETLHMERKKYII